MKQKKKRIIIAAVAVILLILCVLWGVGDYFVDYAITRSAEGNERKVESTYQADVETNDKINKNHRQEEIDTEKWLQSCDKSLVSITSEDGLKLVANEYEVSETKESHDWVLLVHGYGGKKEKMEGMGLRYSERGYRVLIPDMRAHGESEGEYVGMGWLDKTDILQWIQWVIDKDSNAEIVLHGVSMGAATVMMVSGEALPQQVKAVIEDCGYTSVWDIFTSELKARFNLPPFPALYAGRLVGLVRAGYDMKEASALEQVKKCEIPILFIHGDQDDFVPSDMIYPLYEAATCEKEMLIIRGAGHTEARTADPERYYKTVFDFIEKTKGL
ncbi:MAG: alpha/beta hydrolase [Clostridium sp.]